MTTHIFLKILEAISYLSAPILCIFAWRGLKQIKVAQSDITIRSKRESIDMSVKWIDFFRKDIIPLIGSVFSQFAHEKIDLIRFRLKEFTQTEVENHQSNISFHYKRGLNFLAKNGHEKLNEEVVEVANRIESFSIPFIYQIADEKVAFGTLGKIFCEYVEKMFFFYSFERSLDKDYGDDLISFPNTMALYKLWSKRIERNKLSKESKKIEEKLESLESIKTEEKKPIGTDLF